MSVKVFMFVVAVVQLAFMGSVTWALWEMSRRLRQIGAELDAHGVELAVLAKSRSYRLLVQKREEELAAARRSMEAMLEEPTVSEPDTDSNDR